MEKSCCKSCEEGKTCESERGYGKKRGWFGSERKVSNKDALKAVKFELDQPRIDENKVDIIEDEVTVLEAIVRPDRHRNVAFPYYFSTPGTPIHKMNTLTLKTNDAGCCWAEVNFGQYLGINSWRDIVSLGPLLTNQATGKQFGRSNVFVSDPDVATGILDGKTEYDPLVTNITQFLPSRTMIEQHEMYNAVRAGPAAVWYDFTGRLDTSSGTIVAGINYTYSSDLQDSTSANGLLPDMNFITQKAIEDCPYRIQTSVVNSLHGVFLPQDSQVLDLKNPGQGNMNIQQRFFILITGAAKNETIGQLKIAMNFDGKPNAKYADSISTSITRTPSVESLKNATDYLIQNGMVLRIAKDQGYGIMRFAQL